MTNPSLQKILKNSQQYEINKTAVFDYYQIEAHIEPHDFVWTNYPYEGNLDILLTRPNGNPMFISLHLGWSWIVDPNIKALRNLALDHLIHEYYRCIENDTPLTINAQWLEQLFGNQKPYFLEENYIKYRQCSFDAETNTLHLGIRYKDTYRIFG